MIPASRLVRSFIAGIVALGLAAGGVGSPLLMTDCAIAREVSPKNQCCCGENCQCGPSCRESSPNDPQQQSTSVERDLRDLGKFGYSIAQFTSELSGVERLADFQPSLNAAAFWPHTLLAQHTFLRV
jgi:hypothetical protein